MSSHFYFNSRGCIFDCMYVPCNNVPQWFILRRL